MAVKTQFQYTPAVILVPMVMVLLMWTVFYIEVRFGLNLNEYGVYPRTLSGLKGVLFSPFIHGSARHLYNNTFPVIILLSSLFYFYRDISFKVLFWGIILSGLITWGIGRPSYHIGASGLIYVLASFIFFKGIRTRHYRLVALSLAVVFIYGGLLWYIFPLKEEMSWEGHLGGFLSGLLLAMVLKARVPESRKYAWEAEDYDESSDEFMRQFDEDGNFIERAEEDAEEEPPQVRYHYTYKTSEKEKGKED
ncbi:rhomboid family intramembrane serine protease [Zeaxanthinibacter enoshimensis]|uniref:Membrane associated rhomboid family serine protease n=1 Tax=Zeaxanthinibacter enoshimensis TaxID=392009 RepID=A0A4R6TJP0_9FLAO|nr:rhomboid family intramembrane serine protease [Zeaxanthinibacter enoshimensis]TDQ28982.1 membrane associated rhomboid family serine protease [Zeaxanthinibacter enoshimensis]